MGKRVLLVEDERNIVESLTFVLTREGYEVHHALDGETGLSEAQRLLPDVMILDLMLPKISGYDVLKKIRADGMNRELPVLMLTAKGQAHDRRSAEELGVNGFITKPFANSDVILEVARLIEMRDRARP